MTDFLTPVGRLIEGDCFVANTTDSKGAPLVIKKGPNAGQPWQEWYFAIAVRKDDPGLPAALEIVNAEARTAWPQLHGPDGMPKPGMELSLKVVDGDSTKPNKKAQRPCDKANYPGHMIFKFSSGFAPKICSRMSGRMEYLTDAESVKKGYFIQIFGDVVTNSNTESPGVYLNHKGVELIGYGEVIQSGPTPEQMFGAAAPAMPAGASATPVVGAPLPTPAQPVAQGHPPAAMPQNSYPPPVVAAPTPAPVAVAPAPAPPVAPVPEFLKPEPKYLIAGVAYEREALLKAGHTPEMLATYQTDAPRWDVDDDIPF